MLTVGTLKALIADLPDDTSVIVNAEVEDQVSIVGAEVSRHLVPVDAERSDDGYYLTAQEQEEGDYASVIETTPVLLLTTEKPELED